MSKKSENKNKSTGVRGFINRVTGAGNKIEKENGDVTKDVQRIQSHVASGKMTHDEGVEALLKLDLTEEMSEDLLTVDEVEQAEEKKKKPHNSFSSLLESRRIAGQKRNKVIADKAKVAMEERQAFEKKMKGHE